MTIRDKLVDDVGSAWRWLSVQFAALIVIAPELYNQLPQLQAHIDPVWYNRIIMLLAVLVILGRIKKQS